MAGALFANHRDGTVAGRCGNRDAEAVPHGAYPCLDDRWVAFSCRSDAEFETLARRLGQAALSEDPRFATVEARRRNVEALDAVLAEHCGALDSEAVAAALQAVGIAAYPLNTIADLFHDPQLQERRTWRRQRHGEIGDQAYVFPGFDLTSTPGEITRAAPLLGGDNDIVCREFLGMSEDEISAYTDRNAFE
jgi:crotonobetainyl-CoA:carnitine CoA-transferase CaiB-like acyl-CoA transferase